ncbi:MAG: hypothetical protein R3E96_01240 [Planctomycetota bacterium]
MRPLTDEYRTTPDKLYHLGRAQYGAEDLAAARETLLQLMQQFRGDLTPSALKDAARMLLFASIEHGSNEEIVAYFEIIKERDDTLFVPLDKVLRIGDAYTALGEHERAMFIYRASLDETFGLDLKLAAALDAAGKWKESMGLMDRFVAGYPAIPAVEEVAVSLTDRLLQAAKLAQDPELAKRRGWSRPHLLGSAVRGSRCLRCVRPIRACRLLA